MAQWNRHPDGFTAAETVGVALIALPVVVVLAAYVLDLAGLRFLPAPMAIVALAACLGTAASLRTRARRTREDLAILIGMMSGLLAWLLWLARPTLLPLSTGPDLTHHLILIRHIEQHWRLVHDHALERFLGEMAQYTPGSHILAALAGAWSFTDGLRALHPLQAITVALKAGFLFLIGVRLLPPKAPRALAAAGVLLLFASPRYFLGSFTEYGFVAQVVAELFVVAMWWAIVAWDDAPDVRFAVVFGLCGAAAFLTWPVYVGPPALAFFVIVAFRRELRIGDRIGHLAAAYVPLGVFAVTYLIGRLGWLQLAGTGGAAPWPSINSYSWPLVTAASIGFVLALIRRRGRSTAAFLLAVLAQSAAFYLLARRSGAPQPYMALKMFYLLLWPMVACAVMALGEAWSRVSLLVQLTPTRARAAAYVVLGVVVILVSRPLVRQPSRLHPLPPAVSLPLYEAALWARVNVPPACIEYLVGDDETAYWLHLAVLGNPRIWDRTGDNSTYEPKDAVMRWLTPNGLPYGIADLPTLPRDVRDELDIVQRFGSAAIVKRRGPSTCSQP